MRHRNVLGRLIGLGLAALLLIQGARAVQQVRSVSTNAPPLPFLRIGDPVPPLRTSLSTGSDSTITIGAATVTVLLAFSNSCGHCHTVAPSWRELLDSSDALRGSSVQAISRDARDIGEAFLERYGLRLDLLSVRAGPAPDPGMMLTAMTPWLYVIDTDGTIVFTGSGWVLRDALRLADSLSTASLAARRPAA